MDLDGMPGGGKGIGSIFQEVLSTWRSSLWRSRVLYIIFYVIVKTIMQCTTTLLDVLTYVHTVSVTGIF